jgi:hypothetical protein
MQDPIDLVPGRPCDTNLSRRFKYWAVTNNNGRYVSFHWKTARLSMRYILLVQSCSPPVSYFAVEIYMWAEDIV